MTDLSKTIDLSTHYLGLTLKNPLVPSAGPMCEHIDNIRRMEDAGAAAGRDHRHRVAHSWCDSVVAGDSPVAGADPRFWPHLAG